MRLYEINAELENAFANAIDAETGEIVDEAMAERFEQLQIDRDVKIENIACLIKDISAEVAAIKAEKDALYARQKSAENKVTSLKKYLAACIGDETFKSPRAAISWRKSTAVNITDIDAIPEQYRKITVDANKTDIKAALKAGETVDGAELVENKNIVIK